MKQLAVTQPSMRHIRIQQFGLRERHDTYGQLIATATASIVPFDHVGQCEGFHFAVFIFFLINNARDDVIEDIAFALFLFLLRLCISAFRRWPDE